MQVPDLSQTLVQLESARQGDKGALNALFERYLPRVRRVIAGRMGKTLGELGDIDDIVQETMLDAFRGLERFTYRSDGSFCHWIIRCAENRIRMTWRAGRAEKRGGQREKRIADLSTSHLSESLFGSDGFSASQFASARETEVQLEKAILQLSEAHREVIHLRAICRMSFREVADTLGLRNENTANVMFLRARKRIAELLDTESLDEGDSVSEA